MAVRTERTIVFAKTQCEYARFLCRAVEDAGPYMSAFTKNQGVLQKSNTPFEILSGVIDQQPLVEPDTFGQGRQGHILIHRMAGCVLSIVHADRSKPQRRIRQRVEMTAVGTAHDQVRRCTRIGEMLLNGLLHKGIGLGMNIGHRRGIRCSSTSKSKSYFLPYFFSTARDCSQF